MANQQIQIDILIQKAQASQSLTDFRKNLRELQVALGQATDPKDVQRLQNAIAATRKEQEDFTARLKTLTGDKFDILARGAQNVQQSLLGATVALKAFTGENTELSKALEGVDKAFSILLFAGSLKELGRIFDDVGTGLFSTSAGINALDKASKATSLSVGTLRKVLGALTSVGVLLAITTLVDLFQKFNNTAIDVEKVLKDFTTKGFLGDLTKDLEKLNKELELFNNNSFGDQARTLKRLEGVIFLRKEEARLQNEILKRQKIISVEQEKIPFLNKVLGIEAGNLIKKNQDQIEDYQKIIAGLGVEIAKFENDILKDISEGTFISNLNSVIENQLSKLSVDIVNITNGLNEELLSNEKSYIEELKKLRDDDEQGREFLEVRRLAGEIQIKEKFYKLLLNNEKVFYDSLQNIRDTDLKDIRKTTEEFLKSQIVTIRSAALSKVISDDQADRLINNINEQYNFILNQTRDNIIKEIDDQKGKLIDAQSNLLGVDKEALELARKKTIKSIDTIYGTGGDVEKELEKIFENNAKNNPFTITPAVEAPNIPLAALKEFILKYSEEIDRALQAAQQISFELNNIFQTNLNAQLDAFTASIDRRTQEIQGFYDEQLNRQDLTERKRVSIEKKRDQELAKLDQQRRAKEKEINDRRAAGQLASDLATTTFIVAQQTAQALLANPAIIPFIVASGIAASSAAIARFNAERSREFGDGGLLVGKSHSQGGIRGTGAFNDVVVEGGEFIVNRRASANFLPILESINSNGGNGMNSDFMSEIRGINSRLETLINSPARAYVIESELTAVQNRVGQLERKIKIS